jgi:hypothetical protein
MIGQRTVKATQVFADKHYTAESREAFMPRTRVVLAKDIEYGLPLEPVPLKAPTDRVASQSLKSFEIRIICRRDRLRTRGN